LHHIDTSPILLRVKMPDGQRTVGATLQFGGNFGGGRLGRIEKTSLMRPPVKVPT
jgi:hypothetical protein